MSARRLALAVLPLALLAGAGSVAAQVHAATASTVPAARGLRYTFTMTGGDDGDEIKRGTVHAVGDRSRIDLRDADGDPGSWLLVSDSGRTLTVVDPEHRTYNEMEADKFAGLLSTVMRGLGAVITFDVSDMAVTAERVGPGGMVAGRQTERWALVQEFTVNVGMFGKSSPTLHRVVTDYWIAPGLQLPRNPLAELLSGAETALAMGNSTFVRRTAAQRRTLPAGAALRVVVTSASSDADRLTTKAPKMRRLEVTSLSQATIDSALFRVPAGYERKEGMTGMNLGF